MQACRQPCGPEGSDKRQWLFSYSGVGQEVREGEHGKDRGQKNKDEVNKEEGRNERKDNWQGAACATAAVAIA